MNRAARASVLLVFAMLAGACNVHIVGDSTAYLVKAWAAERDVTISGSPTPSCGYTTINGDRAVPDDFSKTYPTCLLDWNGAAPDDPADVVVAFVSIHDAMCSTVDGCIPIAADGYARAHADLVALGQPVVWVEVPPVGGPLLRSRINELNAAVAAELGCALVDSSVRDAPTWDGIHYLQEGGELVGVRLSVVAETAAPCPG